MKKKECCECFGCSFGNYSIEKGWVRETDLVLSFEG
jgi:hypothetical protein